MGQVRQSQEDSGNGSSGLSISINKLQVTVCSHIAEVTGSSPVSPTILDQVKPVANDVIHSMTAETTFLNPNTRSLEFSDDVHIYHGWPKATIVQDCTGVAEHMDVRERALSGRLFMCCPGTSQRVAVH